MPITVAHPSAVVLLRWTGLPMSALVVGSMVPDVPVIALGMRGYAVTHSALGVVSVDVVLTLVVLLVWFSLVRDALVDVAPSAVRSRLSARARPSQRQWLLAPLAGAIGAATHVFWDEFTHRSGWGVAQSPWLQSQHAGLFGFKWAQYLSGVVGMLVLAAVVVSHFSHLDVRSAAMDSPRLLPRWSFFVPLAVAGGIGALAGLASVDEGIHAVAFDGVTVGLFVVGVGAVVLAVAWHLVRAAHRA